jgi:hypothetical protein
VFKTLRFLIGAAATAAVAMFTIMVVAALALWGIIAFGVVKGIDAARGNQRIRSVGARRTSHKHRAGTFTKRAWNNAPGFDDHIDV